MGKYVFSDEQRSLLEGLSQPLAIYQFIDKRVVTLILSDGFLELFGYEDRDLAYFEMDHDMYKDTHPDDAARIADAAFRFATEGGRFEVIYRTKEKDSDEYRMVHAMGKHVYTEDGTRLAHIWYTDEGIYTDDHGQYREELSQTLNRALHEESFMRASQYDFLTGMPNMTYFFELAELAKKNEEKNGRDPVMLFMDLRGMKFFNTHNGFTEGDKLLREFAALMRQTFGNENCCRIGEDHFAVFAVEEGLEETLGSFLQECKDINDGNNLPVHIGIYPSRFEDVSASIALDRAKFACDAMTNTYESGFYFYDHRLLEDAEHRNYIVGNLDRALSENWIQVRYQPIIRAVNGRICDEEALSRWIDPDRGTLSPSQFIPILEEAGTIYKLDLYVLEQVLAKIKDQMREGLIIVPHSINLSRSDFSACDIVEEIRRRVDEADIPRDRITIEITESTLGSDFEFMKEQVGRFQRLGFPVWMDDFGSGYSSLEVLQLIRFELIKFDMGFIQRLDEGESGKIILTELMKMVNALGVDSICEGVETFEQMRFLREIGCAKLQGFYFSKPVPYEEILLKYSEGKQIGYEDPEESAYYEAIGRTNLHDLAVIADEKETPFQNFFNSLPTGIIEIRADSVEYMRTNQSYRDYVKRFFGIALTEENCIFPKTAPGGVRTTFMQIVDRCCDTEGRAFFDEAMPDGSTVHSFARWISTNPVTGTKAVAVAVLSVTDPNEGATYASIARALAADYYNIYAVDLDTEKFIEYSSPVGGEELAMERHGENFFASARRDTEIRIYEKDRESFLAGFTKENILRELNEQGVYTTTYRLIDSGQPVYVNMKIMRMHPGGNQVIMGISVIDSQMREKELLNAIRKEQDVFAMVMALSENYLSLYTVDPDTGSYVEYNSTNEYDSLGFDKTGADFFRQGIIDGKKTVCPEDLPLYLERFTKENVLRDIQDEGVFNLRYRLMINGEARPVILRIARVMESDGDKLIAGVRIWRERKRGKKE